MHKLDLKEVNMGKIINMVDHQRDYQKQLQETQAYLESVRDELFTHMINIASQGVWKGWMKEIESGKCFYFSQDMLENTGDKYVEALWELCYKIIEVEVRLAQVR